MIFKIAAVSTALILGMADTRADLVIHQRVEGGGQKGTATTLRVQGQKLRVDMASRVGPISSIMDMETGDSMVLMHGQRTVTRTSGAKARESAAIMKQRAQVKSLEPAKPVPTGLTEKIGAFNADIYIWKGAGRVQKIWVTKEVNNLGKVKEQVDRLSKSAFAEIQQGIMPDVSTLPGIVVKTELEMDGQLFTATVLSVKEEELNPALFEAPPDYRDTVTRKVGKPAPETAAN